MKVDDDNPYTNPETRVFRGLKSVPDLYLVNGKSL